MSVDFNQVLNDGFIISFLKDKKINILFFFLIEMITKSSGVFYKKALGMRNKAVWEANEIAMFVDIGNKCMSNTLLINYFSSSPKQTHNETINQQHEISFDIRTILHTSNKVSTSSTIKESNENIKTQNENQKENSLYKDLINSYKENKLRLEQLKKKEDIFNENYVKKLVDMKYFYADVVNVASWLTENLIENLDYTKRNQQQKDENQTQAAQQNVQSITPHSPPSPITPTHLHFLLYVYHLYPKQSRNLKDRMIMLLIHFVNSQQLIDLNVSQNMQFLFYLRKFIENQYYHKFGKNIIQTIHINYTKKLQLAYIKHKQYWQKRRMNEQKEKQKGQFGRQMIFKSKILHNYLLIFPNLWNSPKRSKNSQPQSFQKQAQIINSSISRQVLSVYDFLVQQFSQILKQSINYWLNEKKLNNNQNNNQIQMNYNEKKNLQQRFKQLEMKKVLDELKLCLHRLIVIFDLSKTAHLNKRNNKKQGGKQIQQGNMQQQQNLSIQYLQSLVQKYSQGYLNVINYLPSDKLATQNQLLTLMILFKNLASYHAIRSINNHIITDYLFNLFENNTHLINTNQPELRKQIKITIAQIVSKLSSANWTDKDDRLHKFLTPEVPHNKNGKTTAKRDIHGGQWLQQIKDY